MPEDLNPFLALHPDRGVLPRKVFDLLEEWNLDGSEWVLAWQLSGLAPASEGLRMPLFAICLGLLAAQAQGHTRLSLAPDPLGPTGQLFQAFGLSELNPKVFLKGLPALVGKLGEAKPLIVEGEWLYSQRLLHHEEQLEGMIGALVKARFPPPVPPPEDVFRVPDPLDVEQRRAVIMALGGGLTLVTGGPGTGKTSIVGSILRALLHQPGLLLEDIALAAPTGKAAQRMGDAIQTNLKKIKELRKEERPLLDKLQTPITLHRLLAWHPSLETFSHGPGNPLAAKVVIVDEASMISQEHMFRLLGALNPSARLVLLGDADQLPSVEEGCAFREMVASLAGNTVELVENHRMRAEDPNGANIISVALAIRDEKKDSLWDGSEPISCRVTLDQVAYEKVEWLDPSEGRLEAFLDRWFEKRVAGLEGFETLAKRIYHFAGNWDAGDEQCLGALFGHFNRFRILCALREAGQLRGVQDINRFCHRRMLDLTGEGLKGLTPFCAGEPVMMTSNDYRRGIYNGDQGIILKVQFDRQLRQAAVFPQAGGFIPFPLEPLKDLVEQAYAITVHKSQGSEYDQVAIVLPKTNHKALTRELLYTGITRARKSVVLLAEKDRIPYASGNPSRRDSGLAERLGRSAALREPGFVPLLPEIVDAPDSDHPAAGLDHEQN
jgi:exodeoxyribonuclease V alpha subunit